MKDTNCPNCGAPVFPAERKCPYCETPYKEITEGVSQAYDVNNNIVLKLHCNETELAKLLQSYIDLAGSGGSGGRARRIYYV